MSGLALLHENGAFRSALLVAGLLLVGLVAGGVVALVTPAYVAAGMVGVVAALVLISSPQASLLALLAVATLLPFAAIPLPIGFVPTFLDVVLITFFVGWLARLVNRSDDHLVATPLTGPLLAFMGLAVVSLVMSQGLNQSIARYFVEMLLAMALFFGVVNAVRQRRQVDMLVWALIIGAALAASVGIVLYYLPRDTSVYLLSTLRVLNYPAGSGVLRFLNDDPAQAMRAIATSIDPNVLGGLLMVASGLAVPQLFRDGSLRRRAALLAALGVMGWCLLLTLSRGSWVGLAASVAFIATLKYRRMWLLIIVVAAGVFVLPEAEAYVAHLLSGIQMQDKAAAMRLGEYTDALKLIARYPLLGIGFGSSPTIDLYLGVSNVYLLIAEETGLLGLGAYLLTLATLFQQGMRRLVNCRDPRLQATLAGLLAALSAACTAGILDHYFFNLVFPHMAALFWMLAGLVMVVVRLPDEAPGASPAGANENA
ncbi:MAG: O-antigen ligase family protein [Chloroflexota bacterium]|nr:O-antigen ligase family protein [Chloroflexota bacterium]